MALIIELAKEPTGYIVPAAPDWRKQKSYNKNDVDFLMHGLLSEVLEWFDDVDAKVPPILKRRVKREMNRLENVIRASVGAGGV